MGRRRKVAIAMVVVSLAGALAGCSAKSANQGSPTPTIQPTASVTSSPSPAPTLAGSPVPATANPQPTATQPPKPSPSSKPPSFTTAEDAKKVIEARSQEVIAVLKEKNMAKLATLVHPKKGVQFSPYSNIQTATDIQVQSSNLATLWASSSLTNWGTFDGSGDPIDLTFPNYWAKFVYNANFAAAPQISYNTIIGKGNMINNVFSIYPAASYITVEYHFPGFDPQYQGMDWTSLRLVYEYTGSQWYLVAIVHDQHTM